MTQRLGNNRLKDGAVTGNKIADTAVNSNNIVDGAVTTIKLGNQSVDGDKLKLGAVDTKHFVPLSVKGNVIGISAISTNNIVDGAITAGKIAPGASGNPAAFPTANAAFDTANASFITANAAFVQANAAFNQTNISFTQANAAFIQANVAFNEADSAFIRANNSLNANVGGGITANVNITGNLQTANVTINTHIRFANTDLAGTGIVDGQIEYSDLQFYGTIDDVTGRGYMPVTQIYYMTANSVAAISTAALPVLGNSTGFTVSANAFYEVEWDVYFLKTTAGTVTFTIRLTNGAGAAVNPQYVNARLLGGRADVAGPANSAGRLAATADPVALPATPTLGAGTVNFFNIKAIILTNLTTGGNCFLQAACSAGTMTAYRNSHVKVTKLPTNRTGIFN
jgi:hypothetical protein